MIIAYETRADDYITEQVHNGTEFETRFKKLERPRTVFRVLRREPCCPLMESHWEEFDFRNGQFGFYHYDDSDHGPTTEKMVPVLYCPWCGHGITTEHVRHIRQEPIVERVLRKTLVYQTSVVAREEDVITAIHEVEETPAWCPLPEKR
jgi:hypothetical protein